jgi:PPM family protein phosphatase
MVREGNEDSAYAGSRLALVADGMGGHAAGEIASSEVVAALAQLDEDEVGLDLLEVLASAVQTANDHLRAMVDSNAALDGMGTTLTAMLSSGTRLGLAHVGDSRAYLLRDGEFTQLTHDQTLVQRMVDEGRITAEQAETHPQRSLLTQALDGRAGVEPDLSVREARRGDRYLLCSDGLSGYVPHDAIAETLRLPDADEAAERLIDLALQAGAPDNVTVVIADVVDDEAGLPNVPVVGGAAAEQEAVPSAAAAVVLPGGASLSPQERTAKREARRPHRTREAAPAPSPGGDPGSPERAVDTGVYRRPAIGDDPDPPAAPTAMEETPPTGMPPVLDEPRRRRVRRRSWYRRPVPLVLTGACVVIVAGVLITWAIVANSWYVARDGDTAALFHGIRSEPLGVSLSAVEQRGTALRALLPVDQERVRGGIVANSRADGVCILARLRFNAQDAARQTAVRAANQERSRPSATPAASPSPDSAKSSAHPTPTTSGSGGRTTGGNASARHVLAGAAASATPSASHRPTPAPTISLPPTPAPLPKSCAS